MALSAVLASPLVSTWYLAGSRYAQPQDMSLNSTRMTKQVSICPKICRRRIKKKNNNNNNNNNKRRRREPGTLMSVSVAIGRSSQLY
jgi:hypothetical protein